MMKTKLAVAALVIAGLAGAPFAAAAKTHKTMRHHSATTTTGANTKTGATTTGANTKTTTGANMKPSGTPSPQTGK
jgi:hypothetical protein